MSSLVQLVIKRTLSSYDLVPLTTGARISFHEVARQTVYSFSRKRLLALKFENFCFLNKTLVF